VSAVDAAETTPDSAAAPEPPHTPAALHPGLYGNARRRLPLFAAAGCVSLALGIIPFPTSRPFEAAGAIAAFVVLTVATFVLPWPRMATWSWPLVPVGYVGVVALLRDAQGGGTSGLVYLLFLPVVWLALYGRQSHLVVGLVAMALALVVPVVIVGAPAYPASEWRLTTITLLVSAVVSFSLLSFVSRDRAYVADLAEQSRLARRSARSAEAAREQLDSLLRAATETAVIGCDDDGLVTFFSAGAQKILGYRPEEVVGIHTVFDFVDPDELARRQPDLDELVAAADGLIPSTGEESIWTYVRKDGARRKVAGVLTSRRTADGTHGYVVVAGDVTERDQLATEQERLLAAQQEVTQALVDQNRRLRELTKVKDDVVAAVSHELRTPLTSIRGFAELLLDDPEHALDDDQAHMMRAIERSALHLLQVAEDLLAEPGASHGLQVSFVDVDLATIAVEAVDALRLTAEQRTMSVSVVAHQPVVVHADPARLHQLLGNLLSNAIKFTGAGGQVMVRVSRHGQLARLDVLDDGTGIPVDERSQLFERFYRLASSTQHGIPGTGLGLAIAKSVVEAHDGTIDVVDTPGWSTTFRVHLPVTRHQAVSTPVGSEPVGSEQ